MRECPAGRARSGAGNEVIKGVCFGAVVCSIPAIIYTAEEILTSPNANQTFAEKMVPWVLLMLPRVIFAAILGGSVGCLIRSWSHYRGRHIVLFALSFGFTFGLLLGYLRLLTMQLISYVGFFNDPYVLYGVSKSFQEPLSLFNLFIYSDDWISSIFTAMALGAGLSLLIYHFLRYQFQKAWIHAALEGALVSVSSALLLICLLDDGYVAHLWNSYDFWFFFDDWQHFSALFTPFFNPIILFPALYCAGRACWSAC